MTNSSLAVQEQADGVLYDLLDPLEEGDTLAAVDQAVVVGEGNIHHGAGQDVVAYHLHDVVCFAKETAG